MQEDFSYAKKIALCLHAHKPEKGSYKQGDTVHFSFKGNAAHVFSKETDKNLEYRFFLLTRAGRRSDASDRRLRMSKNFAKASDGRATGELEGRGCPSSHLIYAKLGAFSETPSFAYQAADNSGDSLVSRFAGRIKKGTNPKRISSKIRQLPRTGRCRI